MNERIGKKDGPCNDAPVSLCACLHAGSMICLFAFVLVFFCSTVHSSAVAATITEASCKEFINESPARVTCGFVKLPEHHEAATENTVSIPILIAKSTRTLIHTAEKAILIPGGGGPGGSVGFGFNYTSGEYLKPYESLLQAGFDVVILDQRGTGLARPALHCPETIESFKNLIVRSRTVEEEINSYRTSILQCRQRLQDNSIDVNSYDSRQSALDFLAVMDALPYHWWGTLATSYATVLAQAMLLLKPQAFDRVVLDSPVPLDYQQPMTDEVAYQAVVKIIERCNREAECKSRYADLQQKLDSILEQARHQPYKIKIRLYNDGASHEKTLIADNSSLLSIFLTAIYSNKSIAELPRTIHRFHQGYNHALKSFTETYWYQSVNADFADGLNLTIHCKERLPLESSYLRSNPDVIDSLSRNSKAMLEAHTELCTLWKATGPYTLLPKQQFTPRALFLAGGLDPVINKSDINSSADDFSRRTATVIFPGAGHSIWFQSECAKQLTVDFFQHQGEFPTSVICDDTQPTFK
ncbi:hypothetical protein AB833_19585 [Chromatiales bacterium (ex Bugula neritina AB1)]|nr:hypothetical protein AB833_19585 [Chromatiales bacterium (ex Bugula neritina AB1)]